MTDRQPKRILFRVEETDRFPRSLWDRLKARAAEDREPWIDALRRAVERYLERKEPKP